MNARARRLQRVARTLCAASQLSIAAACQSTVLLGDECRNSERACSLSQGQGQGQGDGDGDGDGDGVAAGDGDREAGDGDSTRGDSGPEPSMDGGGEPMLDAGSSRDAASTDASVVLPVLDAGPGTPAPALRNPSFERVTGKRAGDLNFSAFRALDPWYVCLAPTQINFVRVEEKIEATPANPAVSPQDGRYFVGFSYMYVVDLTVPVAQQLVTPLKAGRRYAFLVDVRGQAGGGEQLGLIVRGGTNLTPCAFLTTLAETDYLPSDQWTTECITFTSDTDLTQIAFMPKNKNGIAVTNRFFIDNIRTDPSCQ